LVCKYITPGLYLAVKISIFKMEFLLNQFTDT
jgi:hypothetical protein